MQNTVKFMQLVPGERKRDIKLTENIKTVPGERKEKFQFHLLFYNRPWGEKKRDISETC